MKELLVATLGIWYFAISAIVYAQNLDEETRVIVPQEETEISSTSPNSIITLEVSLFDGAVQISGIHNCNGTSVLKTDNNGVIQCEPDGGGGINLNVLDNLFLDNTNGLLDIASSTSTGTNTPSTSTLTSASGFLDLGSTTLPSLLVIGEQEIFDNEFAIATTSVGINMEVIEQNLGTGLSLVEEKYEIEMNQPAEFGESKIEMNTSRPEVRFHKWNSEIDLGIKYGKLGNKIAQRNGNKTEWKDVKEEVHAYQIDKDNFEIEIVLNEKPLTNKFDFQVNGAENLDFFYQAALTEEEINDGMERPENVIGSYAVYHKTKLNYEVGNLNYASGKAFHIYRPKTIDSNGKEEWAILSYDNGILSIEVSQLFLDTAQYPVIVDPTFGFTSCGGSTSFINSATAAIRRAIIATTTAGTLDSISACLSREASATETVRMYVNRKNSAGTNSHGQIAKYSQSLSLTTTGTFFTFSAANENLESEDYLISVHAGVLAPDNNNRQRVSNDTGGKYGSGSANESFTSDANAQEDPWTVTPGVTTPRFSIYATFTESQDPHSLWWSIF